jgi:hypothetical protein
MNDRFLFMYGFRLIELLAAAGIVFLAVYCCRVKPDGSIARFLRHRDRLWFALLLLFVPAIVARFFLFYFWGHPTRGPNVMAETVIVMFNIFYGAIYGIAGCLFASPAKREEPFNYWSPLTVAVVLIILASGLSMVTNSFRFGPAGNLPVISAAMLILAYFVSRAFAEKDVTTSQDDATVGNPNEKEHNPAFAFLWLLIGLAPIPVLLVFASTQRPQPYPDLAVAVLIICALCNLCGAFGCLGGIKNVTVRVILGIFLGIFLFLLSWLVALLEMCSHSGGI